MAIFPVCCFIRFLWLRWDWRITKCFSTSDVLINSSMCYDPFSQSQKHKHFAERWLSCADVWRGSVIDVNHAGHSARTFHPDAHRWLATVTCQLGSNQRGCCEWPWQMVRAKAVSAASRWFLTHFSIYSLLRFLCHSLLFSVILHLSVSLFGDLFKEMILLLTVISSEGERV